MKIIRFTKVDFGNVNLRIFVPGALACECEYSATWWHWNCPRSKANQSWTKTIWCPTSTQAPQGLKIRRKIIDIDEAIAKQLSETVERFIIPAWLESKQLPCTAVSRIWAQPTLETSGGSWDRFGLAVKTRKRETWKYRTKKGIIIRKI